jgi:hypothetical protein
VANAQLLTLGRTTYRGSVAVTYGTFVLDASTDAIEWVFQAQEAATLTRLGLRLTSAASSPTYRFSLQGVSGAGRADGTVKGGGAPASATFNPTSLGWAANTWHWVTLDNSYACTRGEWLAAVIEHSTGTIGASNSATFTTDFTNAMADYCGRPYVVRVNVGTGTKQTRLPIFGYGSASAAYGNPLKNFNHVSFAETSTPDEYGLKFTLPAGWGDTFRVRGVEYGGGFAAGSTALLRLYEGDTLLQSVTVDGDQDGGTGGNPIMSRLLFTDSPLADLSFGTTYRVTLHSTAGATNITLEYLEVDAEADWDAWPMGRDWVLTERSDDAAWSGGTDTPTRRPTMALLLDDWAEPGLTRGYNRGLFRGAL